MTEILTGKQVLTLLAQDEPPEIEALVEEGWRTFQPHHWHLNSVLTAGYKFRIKPTPPRRLSVTLANGEVVSWPEPVREELNDDTDYYFGKGGEVEQCEWDNHRLDKARLAAGIIHLTQEAAQEHADALRKINTQGVGEMLSDDIIEFGEALSDDEIEFGELCRNLWAKQTNKPMTQREIEFARAIIAAYRTELRQGAELPEAIGKIVYDPDGKFATTVWKDSGGGYPVGTTYYLGHQLLAYGDSRYQAGYLRGIDDAKQVIRGRWKGGRPQEVVDDCTAAIDKLKGCE